MFDIKPTITEQQLYSEPKIDPANPASFGEVFDSAMKDVWASGQVVSDINNERETWDAHIKKVTGLIPEAKLVNPTFADGPYLDGARKTFLDELEKLAQKRPDLRDQLLPERDFQDTARGLVRSSRMKTNEAWEKSDKGIAAWSASLAGSFVGQLSDPLNAAAMLATPMVKAAPGLWGLAAAAGKSGAYNAAAEVAMQPFIRSYSESAGLPVTYAESAVQVGAAFGLGAGLDLGFRGAIRGVQTYRGLTPILENDHIIGWKRPGDVPDPATVAAPGTLIEPTPLDISPELTARAFGEGADAVAARAEIAKRIESAPDHVSMETVIKAESGDVAAQRKVAEVTGEIERPDVRARIEAEETANATLRNRPSELVDDDTHLAAVKQSLAYVADPQGNLPPARVLESGPATGWLRDLREKVDELQARVQNELTDEDRKALLVVNTFDRANADPVAAARILRDEPALMTRDLDFGETGLGQARSIATLSDEAFERVASGEYAPEIGALVADHVPEGFQIRALQDLTDRAPTSEAAARAMLADMLNSPDYRPPSLDAESPVTLRERQMDDPYGKEAQAQVQQLENDLAEELGRKAAPDPTPVEVITDAIKKADEVRAAIESVSGMLPEGVRVKTYTALSDVPDTVVADMLAANRQRFERASLAYQIADNAEARALARLELDEALALRGVEAFVDTADANTIWLASYAMNPRGRIAHEAVHILKAQGRIAPDELTALAQFARESGAFSPSRQASYAEAYAKRGTPERIAELLDEEAVSHLIEARANGKLDPVDIPPRVLTVLDRIAEFFDSIRNALVGKGFKSTAETTFAARKAQAAEIERLIGTIMDGEAAKRVATQAVMQAEDIKAMAVRPGAASDMRAAIAEPAMDTPAVRDPMSEQIDGAIDQGVAVARMAGIDVDPLAVRGMVDEAMGNDLATQLAAREAAADALMQTPEYKAATAMDPSHSSHLREGYGSDADRAARTFQTPDGEIKGVDAAAEYLYRKAVEAVPGGVAAERKVFVLIGYPGAGKSSIAEAIRSQRRAVHIVADDAKLIVPEYEGGKGSSFVHEESADLANDVLATAAKNGDNIIVEKLGSSDKSIDKVADQFKRNGYEVALIHVDVDRAIAKERAARRFTKTGRGVPAGIYNELQAGNVFDTVIRKGNIDAKATVRWDEPSRSWQLEAADPAISDLTIASREQTASRERGLVGRAEPVVSGSGVQARGPEVNEAVKSIPGSHFPRDTMFAFAGERARNADLEALSRAKAMADEGKNRTEIWTSTGWFRGVDGKWRFEIDDGGARFARGGAPDRASLVDLIDNPNVYNAYPDMEGIYATLTRGGEGGSHDPGHPLETIRIRGAGNPDALGTGLHETQHAVQLREAMASGGNLSMFSSREISAERWRMLDKHGDVIPKSDAAYLLYHKLAGEVEARTVQRRMAMSPDERRARPPWLDYDVPEADQIVRFGQGQQNSETLFAMRDLAERNNAKLIDDLKPGDPIPPRVLVFHGAEYGGPQSGERFDSTHNDIFFSSREYVADQYSRGDDRTPMNAAWAASEAAGNLLKLENGGLEIINRAEHDKLIKAVEPIHRRRSVVLPAVVETTGFAFKDFGSTVLARVYDQPLFDAIAAAKADGFKGLVYFADEAPGWADRVGKSNGPQHNVVTWTPETVTSATTGETLFAMRDADTGQSMRRDLDALGYYSAALEAAKGLKQAKGTPEQMLAQLKSAGVKQAEIDATNLAQFLDGKKSVTRDEIASYLEQNRVGVKETTYGGLTERQNRMAQDLFGKDFSKLNGDQQDNIDFKIKKSDDSSQPAKWQSHSLDPSNPTYRETVIHLPETRVSEIDARLEALNKEISTYADMARASDSRAIPSKHIPKFNELRAEAKELSDERANLKRGNFQSNHFSEPNIIGHMMTSMTKHEGKPVYTIDQIQSDWGQKLRDGGVRDEAKIAGLKQRIATEGNIPEIILNKGIDEVRVNGDDIVIRGDITARVDKNTGEVKAADFKHGKFIGQHLSDMLGGDVAKSIFDNADAISGKMREIGLLQAELRTAEATSPGHPLVNTTDQWTTTTLRRAIRQAAEADAEYIAIPSGDTVLSYNPGDAHGMHSFYGRTTERQALNISDNLEALPSTTSRAPVEGIVPKNLRKLLQKLDKDSPAPQRIETLDTPTSGAKGKGFTLFPLTEKVKASVKEDGQALFAMRDERGREKLGAAERAAQLKDDLAAIEARFQASGGDEREKLQAKRAVLLNARALEALIDDIFVNFKGFAGKFNNDLVADPARGLLVAIEGYASVNDVPFKDMHNLHRAIVADAMGRFASVGWEFKKGAITGDLKRRFQKTTIDNMIKEAAGENTGDELAKRLGKEWLATLEYLRQRFNAAGGDIAKLEGYFAPQYHDPEILLMVKQRPWVDYLMGNGTKGSGVLDRKRMIDMNTGKPFEDAALREVLMEMWRTITTAGANKLDPDNPVMTGKGAMYKRHMDHRVIHFKDAESWIKYQREMGSGDPVAAFYGHVNAISRDIAAMERFGANPNLVFERAKAIIRKQAGEYRTNKVAMDELGEVMREAWNKVQSIDQGANFSGAVREAWDSVRAANSKVPDYGKTLADLAQSLDELRIMSRSGQVVDDAAFAKMEANMATLEKVFTKLGGDAEGGPLAIKGRELMDEIRSQADVNSIYAKKKNPADYANGLLTRADNVWASYMGTSNVPGNLRVAQGFSATRNMISAGLLVAAPISSLSDFSTQLAARRFSGMPVSKQLSSFVRSFKNSSKEEMLRAGLGHEVAMAAFQEQALSVKEFSAHQVSGYIADRSHQFSFLSPMTAAQKTAFSHDFMAWMPTLQSKAYNELPPEVQRMFKRHGISIMDWTRLRKVEPDMTSGVPMMTRPVIQDQFGIDLADKYVIMLLRERAFSTIETGHRAKTIWTGNTRPGTFQGEWMRSEAMFKSFPTMYTMLILGRLYGELMNGRWGSAGAYAGAVFIVGSMLGATSIQLKNLIYGRDPENMNPIDNPKFWVRAFSQSGGLGLPSDFINSATDRNQNSMDGMALGPVYALGKAGLNLTLGNLGQYGRDEKSNMGREAVNLARSYTPGALVPWYLRSAYTHMILDQVQDHVDPDAAKARANAIRSRKKNFGNGFYYPPGQATPSRAPDFGAAFGR